MPIGTVNFGRYHCPKCGKLTERRQMPEGEPAPCPSCRAAELDTPGDQGDEAY